VEIIFAGIYHQSAFKLLGTVLQGNRVLHQLLMYFPAASYIFVRIFGLLRMLFDMCNSYIFLNCIVLCGGKKKCFMGNALLVITSLKSNYFQIGQWKICPLSYFRTRHKAGLKRKKKLILRK
jgi:hypothetical protein